MGEMPWISEGPSDDGWSKIRNALASKGYALEQRGKAFWIMRNGRKVVGFREPWVAKDWLKEKFRLYV